MNKNNNEEDFYNLPIQHLPKNELSPLNKKTNQLQSSRSLSSISKLSKTSSKDIDNIDSKISKIESEIAKLESSIKQRQSNNNSQQVTPLKSNNKKNTLPPIDTPNENKTNENMENTNEINDNENINENENENNDDDLREQAEKMTNSQIKRFYYKYDDELFREGYDLPDFLPYVRPQHPKYSKEVIDREEELHNNKRIDLLVKALKDHPSQSNFNTCTTGRSGFSSSRSPYYSTPNGKRTSSMSKSKSSAFVGDTKTLIAQRIAENMKQQEYRKYVLKREIANQKKRFEDYEKEKKEAEERERQKEKERKEEERKHKEYLAEKERERIANLERARKREEERVNKIKNRLHEQELVFLIILLET